MDRVPLSRRYGPVLLVGFSLPAALVLLAAALLQAADPVAEGQKALEAQKYDVAVEHFKTAIANDAKTAASNSP